MGTSSGSLAGSLFASGRMKAADISFELSRNAPIQLISSAGLTLHKGLFSLKKLAKHLKTMLPQDFSQLEIPLAVGVIQSSSSRFELISDGDLIDAVVASCAIPYLFQPVIIKGDYYADGGVKDRVGLTPWASWSESARAIVHLVGTSRPAAKTSSSLEEQEGLIAPKDRSLIVVRTPKASANFFSLKDYTAQKNEAYVASMKALLPHSVGL